MNLTADGKSEGEQIEWINWDDRQLNESDVGKYVHIMLDSGAILSGRFEMDQEDEMFEPIADVVYQKYLINDQDKTVFVFGSPKSWRRRGGAEI